MRRNKNVKVSQSKNVQQAIMAAVLAEIEDVIKQKKRQQKTANNRACTYGVMSEVIKKHRKANPWLNRDVLNNNKCMLSHKKVIHVDSTSNGSSISSLTANGSDAEMEPEMSDKPGEESTIEEDNPDEPIAVVPAAVDNNTPEEPAYNNTAEEPAYDNAAEENAIAVNRGGRPKGTTHAKLRELQRNKKLAMNYAASKAALLKESFSNSGYDRLPKGTYNEVISETESKFSLEEGSLNIKTLLTRVKRGKLTCSSRGRVSPMIALEAHFLDLLLQLAAMRQPVSTKQALQLINSMVATTNLKESIIAWKKANLPGSFDDEKAQYLGPKYWKNFKKRHPELKQRKAVRFDSNREDWCTVENFQKMYDHVYPAMVTSGIAIELEEEKMVTLQGTITDDPTESYGRKTKYFLTRPELLFFVDEVGSNTSQKKDGNVGGQTYVVHQTQRTLLRSSHAPLC